MKHFKSCSSIVEAVTKATLQGVERINGGERVFGGYAPDTYYSTVNDWSMYLTENKRYRIKALKEL